MSDNTHTTTDPKIEAVQRVYAAFGRGDIDGVLAELVDEVDWASEATSDSAPWYGTYHGKDDIPRFVTALGTNVEMLEFTPLSLTSNETDVMATIRWTFRARPTGKTATMNLHHWWRFADGKIAFYRGSDDSELTASVFS